MILIVDLISIEQLDILDSFIFIIGVIITFTFILFKIFSKEETDEENELDYYSRHNIPGKPNKDK